MGLASFGPISLFTTPRDPNTKTKKGRKWGVVRRLRLPSQKVFGSLGKEKAFLEVGTCGLTAEVNRRTALSFSAALSAVPLAGGFLFFPVGGI